MASRRAKASMYLDGRPRRPLRRPLWRLAAVAMGLLGSAAEANAHVSGQSYDQPLPDWLYLFVIGAAIVLALGAGVYFIGQKLTEKPWLTEQDTVVDLHGRGAFALPTAKLGLRVFLAVATVVFSLMVVAYAARMAFGDWRPLPEPWLLWPNTAILILSSIALQWARVAANRGQIGGVRAGLLAGGGLAFAFLLGQLLAWQQLAALGYFAATNPANAFFYLLTALHGVHLLGGLVAWGRTTDKVWRGSDLAQLRLSVELCATYWHFLLLVWLILFALLLFT